MNILNKLKVATILIIVMFTQSASAALIFSNAADGGTLGGNSSFDAGGVGDIGAEDFLLSSASLVEAFSFQALILPENDISGLNVTWSIRDNLGSLPGSSVFASGNNTVTTTDLGLDAAGGFNTFSFYVDITDIFLSASNYWLTLSVGAPNANSSIYWKHTTNGNNNTAFSSNGGVSWNQPYSTVGPNEVFSIYGTVEAVPVPASIALLLVGVAGVFRLRRRA